MGCLTTLPAAMWELMDMCQQAHNPAQSWPCQQAQSWRCRQCGHSSGRPSRACTSERQGHAPLTGGLVLQKGLVCVSSCQEGHGSILVPAGLPHGPAQGSQHDRALAVVSRHQG